MSDSVSIASSHSGANQVGSVGSAGSLPKGDSAENKAATPSTEDLVPGEKTVSDVCCCCPEMVYPLTESFHAHTKWNYIICHYFLKVLCRSNFLQAMEKLEISSSHSMLNLLV